MKNLRELSGIDVPYFEIGREERHLAGVLFYLLNQSNIASRALKALGCDDWDWKSPEFGIYLEYSGPRDIWHQIGKRKKDQIERNKVKRTIILDLLTAGGGLTASKKSELEGNSFKQFNEFFVARANISGDEIESPANWNLKRLGENLSNDDQLIGACKLKWAFRAKPDIVIHADNSHAICLELKLESGEGSYPASSEERKLLKDPKRQLYGPRGEFPFPMYQRELQQFLMKKVLGIESRFWLISKGEDGESRKSWTTFLGGITPLPKLPPCMEAALDFAKGKRSS